ncbi:MAG: hypothetical protein ACR2QK_04820 [Acidimicrobiales bacterium]
MTATVDHPVLSGRSLRFILVDELMNRASGTVTVAELVHSVAEHGYQLRGRASKTISDALRWEVGRGRVIRTGRGRYRYRRAPRSTARRIRIFARRCHTWVVAATRGQQPPPTPPDPRKPTWRPWPTPREAPWEHLGWLWAT